MRRLSVPGTLLILAVLAAIIGATTGAAQAQTSARSGGWSPPRTPDGVPDLRGYWDGSGSDVKQTRSVDLEEHPKTSFLLPGPSLLVDPPGGKIPYQDWALAKKRALVSPDYEYLEADDPHSLWCISGVPRHIYAPRGFQILQTPGLVVIVNEYAHTNRVIPTDGRPHIGPSIKLWYGDSRGRWEENTLVVETTNYNGKAWLAIAGHFTTDALRVVERFTPIDPDTIRYEATIEDPNVYTRPWTIGFRVVRNKEQGYEHLEDACFEGEDLTKGLTKKR